MFMLVFAYKPRITPASKNTMRVKEQCSLPAHLFKGFSDVKTVHILCCT